LNAAARQEKVTVQFAKEILKYFGLPSEVISGI
jgi:hypothetical protein